MSLHREGRWRELRVEPFTPLWGIQYSTRYICTVPVLPSEPHRILLYVTVQIYRAVAVALSEGCNFPGFIRSGFLPTVRNKTQDVYQSRIRSRAVIQYDKLHCSYVRPCWSSSVKLDTGYHSSILYVHRSDDWMGCGFSYQRFL
jgi:hypothetical protein